MARKKPEVAPAVTRIPTAKINSMTIYTAVFFLLTIAYLAESFLPKPDKAILTQYHLSHNGYYWLITPLVIVLVIIWLISLYGSLRVKYYSRLISRTKEGKGINLISNGLLTQTISLPIVSNVTYLLNHTAKNHTALQPAMTIIINYVSLALLGIAFIYIFAGGHKLYSLTPERARQLPYSLWQGFFILAASIYTYFIIIQPLHHPSYRHVYYLTDWLLVLTIAVPYMYFWYLGTRGAYNIFLYRHNVNGIIYRSALSYLAAGIAVVVLGSVITRIISTLSPRIVSLKITPLLLIIYGLLCVIAAGYILIAIGAKKLRKIEEA